MFLHTASIYLWKEIILAIHTRHLQFRVVMTARPAFFIISTLVYRNSHNFPEDWVQKYQKDQEASSFIVLQLGHTNDGNLD